ncbi:unnamed protein product [Pleuronectes platessa]|uniref:Uncharacterized protein n=1 Tax=Pleuronectes platessa TaxID=8262 RepID=A0A9N7U283_PLEPL|nr:unnamed protein product [Pleuronectes platessa]
MDGGILEGGVRGHVKGVVVTDADDGDGGKGGWVGWGVGSLHHPWPCNSPSSELSGAVVTQPNCGALERRITFPLIVVKARWRTFRALMWLDGDGRSRPHANKKKEHVHGQHLYPFTFYMAEISRSG